MKFSYIIMRTHKPSGDGLSLALTLDKNWLIKSELHQPRYPNFIGTFTPTVPFKDKVQCSEPHSFYTPIDQIPSNHYQSLSNSNHKPAGVSLATAGSPTVKIFSPNRTPSEDKRLQNFQTPIERYSNSMRSNSSFIEASSNLSNSHFKRASESATIDQSRRRSSSGGKPTKYLTVVSRLPMNKKISPFGIK